MLLDSNADILSKQQAAHQADANAAERAFNAGIAAAGATALKFVPREGLHLGDLDTAIDKVAELKPLLKPRIIKCLRRRHYV
jgi:hypothetical protein